mmetsp:Transcript_20610/g.34675  ORF Transcript_20610/g.34675 Transcript_20610/m.34675 type:complete len:238 (+) Transcript_20610:85-798(+)
MNDPNNATSSCLEPLPVTGIYETLFRFQEVTGTYMGTKPEHRPWAQGFPLTTPVPGGPDMPTSVSFTHMDLRYPSPTGQDPLLIALRDYYNHFNDASIETDNIAVFPGGRGAVYATLAFLRKEHKVLVEEVEYTPYFDVLKLMQKNYRVVPSNVENNFRPDVSTYRDTLSDDDGRKAFVLKSNPCNPTGEQKDIGSIIILFLKTTTAISKCVLFLCPYCDRRNDGGSRSARSGRFLQ